MMKNVSRLLSLILAVSMLLCMATMASAASVSTSGGSASTPVTLSSTDDGTLDGDPAATALSVTVPTAFPMAMGQDGTVTTATNCRIINNSYGPVRVRSAVISAADGWSLTAFGSKDTLASSKVDSNCIGFRMKIGSGAAVMTDASDSASQTLLSAPAAGCYMTGAGDASGCIAPVSYDAVVTSVSAAVTDATVASVVFVIEWDT